MGDVSRRGLLGGLFRKPAEVLRDKIPEALRGGLPAPRAVEPKRTYPRRLRPADDTVVAKPDAAGRFVVDLRARPLLPGGSIRVQAAELAEPLVLVRVTLEHLACATGECTLDGSDLKWHAGLDNLWCPGCGSQWRLDGSLARGPAHGELLSIHVTEAEGLVRLDVP
jgi:hypothetical protein